MGQLVYHSQKLFNQSQLFQIPFYLLVKVGSFGFQLLDFLHHGMDVDRFFSSSI